MSETPARHSPHHGHAHAPRPSTRLRIDRGGSDSEVAPGRGSLLRSFGVWAGADRPPAAARPVPERRAENRHRVECLAWVGWKSWRRFHMNDALMIDLSRGGARVFLDAAPPARRPIWVFIETPASHAVVKARVLAVEPTASGQFVARVAFVEPCPYAVFEAAVCGLAPVDPRTRAAAPARDVRRGTAAG